jgi:Peptidase family M23
VVCVWPRRPALIVLISLALTTAASAADQFTPVLVTTLNRTAGVFLGTDGKQHVVYELMLTNANPTPATIQKIDVLPASNPSHVLASYQGSILQSQLRTLGKTPVANADIEFDGARLFLVQLAFDQGTPIPQRFLHRITLLGGAVPAPTPQNPVTLQYTIAPIEVTKKVLVVGPPLKGKGWVAFNGCCEIGGAHRAASQTVNGGIYFGQRFAIDWMRLDDKGRLLNGAEANLHSYAAYGADVIAVADGKVVAILDRLKEQTPGILPDMSTITLENIDGNHVILDLGGGAFAFYAHLQPGSIDVSIGQHVKRGQVLGKLGNTGNTSAPHLHFHIMDGLSTLGSNGLPYVIDSFDFDGEVSATKYRSSPNLDGSWNENLLPAPSGRRNQFPMDFAIINFPAQ